MNGELKCLNCQAPLPNARFMQLSDPVGLSRFCSVECLNKYQSDLRQALTQHFSNVNHNPAPSTEWHVEILRASDLRSLNCFGTNSCKATVEEIKP